jgi:serine phosphatase RsbU (regulator of sigma subunit)/tetratricopeptide (TPR) repeat protein
MTRICLLVFLVLFCGAEDVIAQTSLGNKDSLIRTLKTLPRDTNRVNSLIRLDKIASGEQKFDSSIYYAKQALEIATELNWTKGMGVANIDAGVSYWYMGNYTESLNMNYAALGLFQKIDDQKGISQAYNNMGIVYASQKNFNKALECYLITLTIKKQLGDTKSTSSTLINIGSAYDNLKEYDKAFVYYREALTLKRTMGDKRGEGICMLNIGQAHVKVGNMDSALYYLDESLKIRRSINDRRGICSSLSTLGSLHTTLGHFAVAEKYLLEADSISEELGTVDLSAQIYDQLAGLYDTTGRYKEALDAFRMYASLMDTIDLEESRRNADKVDMTIAFETEKLEMQKEQDIKDALAEEEKSQRLIWIIGISVVLAIVIIFSIFLFTRLNIIRRQKSIIERQKIVVEEKSKEVFDSINYARRIQYTLLAQENYLIAHLKDHFVFFQPKDIVSGDFYWASAQDDKFYLAVCDSTGHGVPGAFMSLLNISFLNEAIAERKMTQPAAILDFVRDKLIFNISQDGNKDGMDAVLMCIDRKEKTITYAGANNSPVIVGKLGTIDCEGDRMPVGLSEKMQPFNQHTLQLNENDIVYIFTDGYADQFGGDKGKKYKRSKLLEKLASMSNQGMQLQKDTLSAEFQAWKGNLEQIDDVLVVGIRF